LECGGLTPLFGCPCDLFSENTNLIPSPKAASSRRTSKSEPLNPLFSEGEIVIESAQFKSVEPGQSEKSLSIGLHPM